MSCCRGNTVVHTAVVTILVNFALSQKVSKLFCICLTFLGSVTLYNVLFDKLEEEIELQPHNVQHAPMSWLNHLLSCPWKPPNSIQSPSCLFQKTGKCKSFWKSLSIFYIRASMCRCWGQHETAAPPGFCMGAESCRQISACASLGLCSCSLGQPWQEQQEVPGDAWLLYPCRAHFPWKLLWYQRAPVQSMLSLLQEFLILSFGPPAQDQLLEAQGICSLSLLRTGTVRLEGNHRGSLSRTGLLPCQLWAGARALSWQKCVGRRGIVMKVVYVCFFVAKAPNCQHIFSAYTCQLHQFSWHCTAFILSYGFIAV